MTFGRWTILGALALSLLDAKGHSDFVSSFGFGWLMGPIQSTNDQAEKLELAARI
jgi:hypothetical protein